MSDEHLLMAGCGVSLIVLGAIYIELRERFRSDEEPSEREAQRAEHARRRKRDAA